MGKRKIRKCFYFSNLGKACLIFEIENCTGFIPYKKHIEDKVRESLGLEKTVRMTLHCCVNNYGSSKLKSVVTLHENRIVGVAAEGFSCFTRLSKNKIFRKKRKQLRK